MKRTSQPLSLSSLSTTRWMTQKLSNQTIKSSFFIPIVILLSIMIGYDNVVCGFEFSSSRIPSLALLSSSQSWKPSSSRSTTFPFSAVLPWNRQSLSSSSLSLHRDEVDIMELIVGGPRYELIPLPDSMMDTTLYVGNLDEFVYDNDLSDLFQSVSVLHSLPACVVRKPNFASLRYGFVSFPTVEEKENAIVRFHGSMWKGKRMKVECIKDHPKGGRVSVPEQMVSYVSGAAKKTRNGKTNTLRRVSGSAIGSNKLTGRNPKKNKKDKSRRNPKRNNNNHRNSNRMKP